MHPSANPYPVAPRNGATTPASPDPNRWTVFREIAFRLWAALIVIGAVTGTASALLEQLTAGHQVGLSTPYWALSSGGTHEAGRAVFVGAVVAPAIAALLSWWFVPLRSPRLCRFTARTLVVGTVLALVVWVFGPDVGRALARHNDPSAAMRELLVHAVPALACSWIAGGWIVRWYVRPAMARDVATDSTDERAAHDRRITP